MLKPSVYIRYVRATPGASGGSGGYAVPREIDRMTNPDLRVARSLAALFNPVLYPGVGEVLRITQQELGYLVGLSRQRVNEALQAIQAAGTAVFLRRGFEAALHPETHGKPYEEALDYLQEHDGDVCRQEWRHLSGRAWPPDPSTAGSRSTRRRSRRTATAARRATCECRQSAACCRNRAR